VKLILGIGENLEGKLLLYDGLNMTFDKVEYNKRLTCPVCGENSTNDLAVWSEKITR